jgi:hypothetical protein
LQSELGRLARAHDHDGRGPVVDATGIARRHAARFVEGGLEAGQRLGARLAVDVLVGVEQHRIALALRDADRDDLVLELARVLRRGGFLLASQRKCVLHFARDAVRTGDVFGGDAHVVLVVDVPQAIDDHGVDHLPVAHALTLATAHQDVRRQRHVLLPPPR